MRWLVFAVCLAACGDGSSGEADEPEADLGAAADASPDASPAVDSAVEEADAAPVIDAAADAAAAVRDASPPDALPEPPDAAPPLPEQPVTAPGPYRVGVRETSVTYAVAPSGEMRTLRLLIWYPTRDAEGTPTRYFRGLVRRPEVFTDAAVVGGGALPLLVFSHGSSGTAEQSFTFTEFFASHGWVVAAPDHTGNTFADGMGVSPQLFLWRPQDIHAVLDFMIDGLPADDPLAGRLGDEVVMAGHSFGGYTTLADAGEGFDLAVADASCAGAEAGSEECALYADPGVRALLEAGFGDPRIDVAIPMAPAGGDLFLPAAIDIPVLLITAAGDETLPNPEHGDPIWAALDGEHDLRLDLTHAGHFTFTDACTALPGILNGDGCGEGFIDQAEAFRLIDGYSLAFARRELRGDADADAYLDGDPAGDEAVVSRKP